MISIIVPFYNEEKTIGACLEELLKFNRSEIIAVDDGSTDSSYCRIKDLPVNILRKKNSGKAASLNYAVSKAKGDILVFVDADVIISKSLSKIIGNLFDTFDFLNINDKFKSREVLLDESSFTPPINIIAIKRSTFNALGGFSVLYPLSGGEDLDFLIRLLGHGHRAYLVNTKYFHKGKSMNALKKIRFVVINNFTYIKNIRYSYCRRKLLKNIVGCLRLFGRVFR